MDEIHGVHGGRVVPVGDRGALWDFVRDIVSLEAQDTRFCWGEPQWGRTSQA